MSRLAILMACLFLMGCWSQSETLEFRGETMGTTFSVVAVDHTGDIDPQRVQDGIDATLAHVNSAMSNWDPDSEISRFNSSGTQVVAITPELADVMDVANQIHAASDGQFDVTLGPLIDLWGFGERTAQSAVPSEAEVATAKAAVGQSRLLTLSRDPDTLQKSDADVSVYLAAIAKGHAIDRIAIALSDLGLSDFMVEIGGDLITSGVNPRGTAWRIGIERPDLSSQRVEDVVPLTDLGMATSGDYRNYFEQDGVRYSHIIDAKTGRPITHGTASVTVLADSAMAADAWATALLALGSDRGMALAEKNDLAVFFIDRDPSILEAGFSTLASSRFQEILASEEE
ncbi:MAG: FAD:protein FMN transferase [Pseudomonadota bacterium]